MGFVTPTTLRSAIPDELARPAEDFSPAFLDGIPHINLAGPRSAPYRSISGFLAR